jgi:hypothetical protein
LYIKSNPERQRLLDELGFCWDGNVDLNWSKLILAASIYSNLHDGILDVPQNFLVPKPPAELTHVNDEWPWPEELWGLALGQSLKRIRLKGAYLRGNDQVARRRQLDDIGFIWGISERRFQTFYAALKHYAKLHKAGVFSSAERPKLLKIPVAFKVPENVDSWPTELYNYPLGIKCAAMRRTQLYIKSKPERQRLLEELGFCWVRNVGYRTTWLKVFHAASIYSKLNSGELDVSESFIVPKPPAGMTHVNDEWSWPEELWGLRLGRRIHQIRNYGLYLQGSDQVVRRRQLDDIGFIWDVIEHRFQRFYAALKHYANLNKAGMFSSIERPKLLWVPVSFKVPENVDSWPTELYNYPLGIKCAAMRQSQLYIKNNPKRQRLLEELGFCWDGNVDKNWSKLILAASIYSNLHDGILDVPQNFLVPKPPAELTHVNDEWPWPEELWGLALGQSLKRIRLKGAYLRGNDQVARRRQLDDIGFIWGISERRFQTFYAALKHYAKLHKAGVFSSAERPKLLKIPVAFKVPENVDSWPTELYNYPLGIKCAAMRRTQLYIKSKPERQRLLEELGFCWVRNVGYRTTWLKVFHAASIYSKLNSGELDVSESFIVPKPPAGMTHVNDEWSWPEELWGLRLGRRIHQIRNYGLYLQGSDQVVRRRQLDDIGFIWDVIEHRFQRFYAALKHYANLNKAGVFSSTERPKLLWVPVSFKVPENVDSCTSRAIQSDNGCSTSWDFVGTATLI